MNVTQMFTYKTEKPQEDQDGQIFELLKYLKNKKTPNYGRAILQLHHGDINADKLFSQNKNISVRSKTISERHAQEADQSYLLTNAITMLVS